MGHHAAAVLTRKKAAVSNVLLIGDESTAYAVADSTTNSRTEFFQFTALQTGIVEELEFRTNGTANTEVTSLVMGICSDSGGLPSAALGQGTAAGEPATSSWIKVTGLSIPITAATVYWLAVLPIGVAAKKLSFNAATALGAGTGNVETKASGFTKIETDGTGYDVFNQGPCGFQGRGVITNPPGAQVVLPGAVVIELGTPTQDWKRAAEAGNRVGRREEGATTLTNATKYAEENGMKLCYIYNEQGGASFKTLVESYEQLNAARKATVIAFEFYNESWPGGVGKQFNGKQYAEKWLAATKVQRERNLDVPMLMQTRLDKTIGTKWMDEWATANHAELTISLEPKPEGKTILSTGNWLASHPYFGNMMLAPKEPNNIGVSGATKAYEDTEKNEWGSQRFMKEILYVKNVTGLNVPLAMTEYGCRWSGTFGVVNSVGSHEKHAEFVEKFWAFLKLVKEEAVTTAPTGLVPKVPFVCWYDQYSHRVANEETYGFYYYAEEGKQIEANETNSLFKKYREGAEAL